MSLETYSDAVRAVADVTVAAAVVAASGEFAPPNERYEPSRGVSWVTYTMQTLDNRNMVMGSHLDAGTGVRFNEGQVEFQCFVPVDSGADDAAALAEVVAGALRGVTFTGGSFRNLRLIELGADGEGWYQYNVLAEFWHKEAA